jgi:probable HAF family extracellular repeat protein
MNRVDPVASPLGSSSILNYLYLAVAVLCGLFLSIPIGAQTNVMTTDLGTLGGSYSDAAVNDAGQVVGSSATAGDAGHHAFSWTAAGGMIDLGTFGGSHSYANAVNDTGQVVGVSFTAGDASAHAFSWTVAGGMIDLGTLGGRDSGANAVNDAGQIVGHSFTAGNASYHAVLWQLKLTPAQMISNLIADVTKANFRQAIHLLQNALDSLNRGSARAACNQVGAFINQVRAQAGKSVTGAQANQWLLSANQVRSVLGCQ